MILYQKRTLVPAADVGAPGPLPHHLRGLSDASLADLPAALNAGAVTELDLANTGYVPVVIPDPVVFPVLTRPQLILGLKAVNRLAAMRTAVAGLPADDEAQVYFKEGAAFRRDDPRLEVIRLAAGTVTPTHLDNAFAAGAALAP